MTNNTSSLDPPVSVSRVLTNQDLCSVHLNKNGNVITMYCQNYVGCILIHYIYIYIIVSVKLNGTLVIKY